jgi:hypothetical protein
MASSTPKTKVASAAQRNQNSASGAMYLDIRHFPDLDEVEIIQQPDPQDAEEHVQPAQQGLTEQVTVAAAMLEIDKHHHQGQHGADDHGVAEVGQQSRHRFRPFEESYPGGQL